MKKILLIILGCFLLTSCYSDKNSTIYDNYLIELNTITNSSNSVFPADVNIDVVNITKGKILYKLTIDNPQEDIKNIKAIISHNQKTDDIFPNSGLYEKPLSLIPGKIDNENNIVKGIILAGYIESSRKIEDLNLEIKVLIKYQDNDNKFQKYGYIKRF